MTLFFWSLPTACDLRWGLEHRQTSKLKALPCSFLLPLFTTVVRYNHRHCPKQPVHLPLHLPVTSCHPRCEIQDFKVLILIPATSHSALNLSNACWRSSTEEPNKIRSSAKSRDDILRFSNRTHFRPWLCLEILSLITRKRNENRGQLLWSPTPTEKMHHLMKSSYCFSCRNTYAFLLYSSRLPPDSLMIHVEDCFKMGSRI